MTQLRCLDLSLPTPAENLACDEALLDWCETGHSPTGILRFWEPQQPFVVLGYANRLETEVDVAAAASARVPIFRRCSGGGTVLQAPGCLNYSLILRIDGLLEGITETNCWIMKRNAAAIEAQLGSPIGVKGYTDLALGDSKFSGNAQRRKRHWLLFHGTFLFNADFELMQRLAGSVPALNPQPSTLNPFELMQRVLKHPPKEPPYRAGRSHREFLTAIALSPDTIRQALRQTWNAAKNLDNPPLEQIRTLVAQKYSTDAWNLKW